jgi:hypothetical protein
MIKTGKLECMMTLYLDFHIFLVYYDIQMIGKENCERGGTEYENNGLLSYNSGGRKKHKRN